MQRYIESINKHRQLILNTMDHVWKNPETGYKEWKTHKYMKDAFEALGYEVTEAGNIPGFTALVDTGRPGPTLAIFGEMDGLVVPDHPESDPETGAVHACGHHCQLAALIGIAAALKEPGALDGLSGKILLVVVPAEELIEIEYRMEERKKGRIKYFGGKPEFMWRGLLNGVDLSFMVHTTGMRDYNMNCNAGSNGMLAKSIAFEGVAAHAGGSPHKGVNALYAANLALSAINNLRETFQDKDHIRVHPIITSGGSSVNSIPDLVTLESYVRGGDMNAIAAANAKINRAVAGAAAAMGATATVTDFPGYWPRFYTEDYIDVFADACAQMGFTFEKTDVWEGGCSDMGDISAVMPAFHPNAPGADGNFHGIDFAIVDPENACVNSAKIQLGAVKLLMENECEKAKSIVANNPAMFKTFREYFDFVDNLDMDKQTVTYNEDGKVTLSYKK